MDRFHIYLAGAMSGLSREEQSKWRVKVEDRLRNSDLILRYKYILDIFNPFSYYNYFEQGHKTEKEIMRYEFDKIRKSDLIIVNFNNPSSLGTMAELAVAYEHRIPIVGMSSDLQSLHPWEIEMCTRICDDMDELIEHVSWYYLT